MDGIRYRAIALGLLAALTITACSSDSDEPSASTEPKAASTSSTTASPTAPTTSATPPPATSRLDSIVVLGHSGTTGESSNPGAPGEDAPGNSWATGDNPQVDSIYLRLLATHPALEGHNFNFGEGGSGVAELVTQAAQIATVDPVPDVVVVQSIDNDIRCDGSDPDNYGPYQQTLEKAVDTIEGANKDAVIFFVDQWASVRTYDDAVTKIPHGWESLQGNGPCDVFDSKGNRRPKAEVYLQDLVDHYFGIISKVCARHDHCYTDGGALQRMPLKPADLTPDLNHLSVGGLHEMAARAWQALPRVIRGHG